MKTRDFLLLALFVFLGFASLGYGIYSSVNSYASFGRTVVVKGLCEKDVVADKVVWAIHYSVSTNTLEEFYDLNSFSADKIVSFLTEGGIEEDEITVLLPNIEDRGIYASEGNLPLYNFTATNTIAVKTDKVELVSRLNQDIGVLVKDGIVISRGFDEMQYTFTKLNEIKPEMVEESTKNARSVAEKFAIDSDSSLGKIKTASQGQFSISTPDRYNAHLKQVRVVSTVEYYLVD